MWIHHYPFTLTPAEGANRQFVKGTKGQRLLREILGKCGKYLMMQELTRTALLLTTMNMKVKFDKPNHILPCNQVLPSVLHLRFTIRFQGTKK